MRLIFSSLRLLFLLRGLLLAKEDSKENLVEDVLKDAVLDRQKLHSFNMVLSGVLLTFREERGSGRRVMAVIVNRWYQK